MSGDNENEIELSLKEEVGQMLSDCPTTSNNCNVEKFT
jgi:hypothetical protein